MGILDWVYILMGFLCPLDEQAKALILGQHQAGKSTLLTQLAQGRPGPTLHPTSEEVVIQGAKFVAVHFDGHQQGRYLWSDHLYETGGIVFLVDAADHERFAEVKAELHTLLAAKKARGIPIVVLGNKTDYPNAVSQEKLRYELGLEGISGRPFALYMCSLALGQGGEDALRWLARHM
ncbi:GTP-binding protein-like protein [Hypoxylon cercidicola]|nr:GTP-binding protein-like protein [Hypoxylon cercidicola]